MSKCTGREFRRIHMLDGDFSFIDVRSQLHPESAGASEETVYSFIEGVDGGCFRSVDRCQCVFHGKRRFPRTGWPYKKSRASTIEAAAEKMVDAWYIAA